MSYDIKYRKRAIAYLQEGHTYQETAKVFGISPNTLNAWEKQNRKTGSLERSYRQYTLKVTAAELEAYLTLHPDAYQYEIAKHFGCAQSTIGRIMKRFGITRKKR